MKRRAAFLQLPNERMGATPFIEAFWKRRDPTPGQVETEFKEDHIAASRYDNERSLTGIPGGHKIGGAYTSLWRKTDEIESTRTAAILRVPLRKAAARRRTYAFEKLALPIRGGRKTNIIIEIREGPERTQGEIT